MPRFEAVGERLDMTKARFLGLAFVLASTSLAIPAGAQSSRETPAASAPLSVPSAPPIDDPMLAPLPPAKRLLSSWQEAIAYMRSLSTDLRIALDQVQQAEAKTRIALSAYLPTITGNGVYTHQLITRDVASVPIPGLTTSTQVPLPNLFTGNVQLQQAVINVQQFDEIGISELNEKAGRLSVDDKKRTLALGLANEIVAVVTAERGAEINRGGLRVALEQLDIARRKQALGAANGLDVVRAYQNAANARASLVSGDESLREAREALGLALGVPEEVGVANDVNIDGLAATAMASCRVVQSVEDRPDVAAAQTNLEVAKRNLRNVWYTFLPTVSAASTIAATSSVPNGYPNPTWNVQAILTVPIWDGGARYGNLKSARATEDIEGQTLESLRRQATVQVDQARRQVVVAEMSDKVAREQRDLAAQNDRMTQTAYMAGQGTSLELVTASEAHRQAELNLALQDFGIVKARILAVLALATCPW